MDKRNLNDLLWFLELAEDRSFTKTAARLGIAQSTLSHTIKRLEERMGLRLLTRTTRNVGLTEAGERLRKAMAPRMAEIDADIAALMSLRDTPSGTIKITLSDHALEKIVWPKLSLVLHEFPDIKIELSRDNSMRNIVEEGFDAGIRLGERVERDMIAVRIGPDWRLLAVGSPGYFTKNPIPLHPQELVRHACVNLRQDTSGGLYAWEFEKNTQELRVRVDGQLTFNTSYPTVDAALNGHGIAYAPEDLVREHIDAGRLICVLEDWSPPFSGYYIYYPTRHQNSPAFKVIVDALRCKE